MKKYSNAAVNPCLRSLFNPYNQGKVSSTNTAMMKYPAMMKIVHILKKTSRILLTTDNYLKMTFQNFIVPKTKYSEYYVWQDHHGRLNIFFL